MVEKRTIHGSCHCGEISVTAQITDDKVMACHCSDCQIFGGGPFRAVVIASADNFQMKGYPKEYVKVGDSGNSRIQAFCGDCGTHLYAADMDKTTFNIRTGFLAERHQLIPNRHIFGKSAFSWLGKLANQDWLEAGPGSMPYDGASLMKAEPPRAGE